ncbi:MAG: beta-ketoacyl synthase N-terminal-like domain-containing protein [Cutibacterium avidum]|uniref:beta-ketoacyl [acyl carrier protein] synthase domain-containing protein n=1 Tax=Cutibacterium avidum TaxID=33010 RepID=UPI0022DFBA29|nr:beta-ketoacyl synthase N-terminal-like domain-containing protein [Cutibacterium avidum]MBS5746157.1 hypothetical protein [Propionibacterium sp.]MDK7360080.1 beta-ketoacyl synthase N-terminal-like domain-containing protein [Cutibacterium avidum]MDK7373787.1 beta-ketoacyl synthase N-terminal-like domain-containing protein [Cutibacterium avidum]MDU2073253.1 beta-ketoacyl synthase N-terminal-like domain-containing protein [Cutibacterium avidum]MDU3220431.1 beta-ketoacyl synthase N-terminal-like
MTGLTRGDVIAVLNEVLEPWGISRDSDISLAELGLGSVDYIQVARGLSDLLDVDVPVGKLFMNPQPEQLEEVLAALVGIESSEVGEADDDAGKNESASPLIEDVAIVGMACQLPPDIRTPEQFWDALVTQRDCISVLEESRPWLVEQHLRDHDDTSALPRYAGIVEGMDEFDAAFFNISPLEAQSMDPQQRRLLEVTWHALEDAGERPSSLRATRTGVYVGAQIIDYRDISRITDGASDSYAGHLDSGNHAAMLANRLSRWYDLRGPSLVVNTACSSSGVALHLATQALLSHEVDVAIVAGVNYLGSAATLMCNNLAGMQSSQGRCATFDASADGYVRSEGVVVFVLRRTHEADGYRVRAIVQGTAVNEDGYTGSLRAPNPRAQAALVAEALAEARIGPEQVGMVECHGTGTPLGDPMEVEGLNLALGGVHPDADPALLTSAKTVVGHLESAAALVSVMKAVLSLEHSLVPGLGHFTTVNPDLDPAPGVLALAVENTPWPTGRSDVACISSFGFGGANAHMVVSKPHAQERVEQAWSDAVPLLFSAQSPEALVRLLELVREMLTGADRAGLEQIARGRLAAQPMAYRLTFSASDAEDACEIIDAVLAGDDSRVQRGKVTHDSQSSPQSGQGDTRGEQSTAATPTDTTLGRWVRGEASPWDDNRPGTPTTPLYPFAAERHGLVVQGTRAAHPSRRHALVFSNDSDLRDQAFLSVWEAGNPIVRNYKFAQRNYVPAAAWIEVARYCAAASVAGLAGAVLFEDLRWGEPLAIRKGETQWTRTLVGSRDDGKIDIDVILVSSGEVLFQTTVSAASSVPGCASSVIETTETGAQAWQRDLVAAGVIRAGGYECVVTAAKTTGAAQARIDANSEYHGRGRNVVCDVYTTTDALDIGWWADGESAPAPWPQSVDRLWIAGATPQQTHITACCRDQLVDIVVADAEGQVATRLEGVSYQSQAGKDA